MHPDDLPSVAWFLGIQPIKNKPDPVSAEPVTINPFPFLKTEITPTKPAMKTKLRKRTAKYVWSKSKDGESSDEEDLEEDIENGSYTRMIASAIRNHPNQEATLQEIYSFLYDKYVFLREKRRFWKNSVRQNLRSDKYFVRVNRSKEKPTTWKIDENPVEMEDGKRKKRNKTALVTDSVVKYLEEQNNKNSLIAPSDISLFDQDESFMENSAMYRTSSSHEGSTDNGIGGFVEYDRFTPALHPEENWTETGLEEYDTGVTNHYFGDEDFAHQDQQDPWNGYDYNNQPHYEYAPSTSSLDYYNTSAADSKCTPLPSSNTLLERLRPESSLNERFSQPYAHISW